MFVRKKTHERIVDDLQNDVHSTKESLTESNNQLLNCHNNVAQLEEENKDLKQKNQELQEALDYKEEIYSSENSVTLKITDDLTQVVPTIKVKPDVFEKMVELGYLDDSVNSETKSVSMQAALLVIANEAMEQIIESMSNSVDSPE